MSCLVFSGKAFYLIMSGEAAVLTSSHDDEKPSTKAILRTQKSGATVEVKMYIAWFPYETFEIWCCHEFPHQNTHTHKKKNKHLRATSNKWSLNIEGLVKKKKKKKKKKKTKVWQWHGSKKIGRVRRKGDYFGGRSLVEERNNVATIKPTGKADPSRSLQCFCSSLMVGFWFPKKLEDFLGGLEVWRSWRFRWCLKPCM